MRTWFFLNLADRARKPEGEVKEKNRKLPFTCCVRSLPVWRVFYIQTQKLQVNTGMKSIFAENRARVEDEVGETLILQMCVNALTGLHEHWHEKRERTQLCTRVLCDCNIDIWLHLKKKQTHIMTFVRPHFWLMFFDDCLQTAVTYHQYNTLNWLLLI